jgi:hypothetical protein
LEVTDALARFSGDCKSIVNTSWEVLIEINFMFEAIGDGAKSYVRLILIYYCYLNGLKSFGFWVILIVVEYTGFLLAGSEHGIFSIWGRFRIHPALKGILRLIVIKSQLNIWVVEIFQQLLLLLVGGGLIILKKLPSDFNLFELLCMVVLLLKLCIHLLFLCCELTSSLDPEAIEEKEVVEEVAAGDKLADGFLSLVVGGREEIALVGTSLRVWEICWLRLHFLF